MKCHHFAEESSQVGRWEPDAQGRLRAAALELFAENGYEQTTIANIAERAGVTPRTFFRHYADKREVLFAGAEQLQQAMVRAACGAPASACSLDVVAAALDATSDMFGGNREFAARRLSVINAHSELRERELVKMALLGEVLAGALRERGVDDAEATLAAETGIAVFRVGFERWANDPRDRPLSDVLREALTHLTRFAQG